MRVLCHSFSVEKISTLICLYFFHQCFISSFSGTSVLVSVHFNYYQLFSSVLLGSAKSMHGEVIKQDSEFQLVETVKRHLTGKRHEANYKVHQAAVLWLWDLDTLIVRGDKCFSVPT